MAKKQELQAEWRGFRRTQTASMTPVTEDMVVHFMNTGNLGDVSISAADLKAGSPKIGDMIARNPVNFDDQWLVAKKYFDDNFEVLEEEATFMDRLVKEKKELGIKIQKLRIFLSTAKANELTGRQKSLLEGQVSYMQNYHDILVLRLDDLS